MSANVLTPVLVTAFMAGILGSGHCFGMCGGIAAGFGALAAPGGGGRFAPALVFNGGRLASYVVLGGLAAWLLGGVGPVLDVPKWARMLRLATAAMILLIGLRFLFGVSALDPLEKAGARIWSRVRPLALRLSGRRGMGSAALLGLCWGLVPCGLVYSLLLTAASTGRAHEGAAVMLAFGLGTLPSMLGVAWMSPLLATVMRDRWARRLIGFSLVLLAAWTLVMVLGNSRPH